MMLAENQSKPLLPGTMVTVRPIHEIVATLDKAGAIEGLPFMPEMAPFVGKQFPVWRRVEKTCVEGDQVRRLRNVVYLGDLRCNGEAHEGCDKECRLLWHEAWLRPAAPGQPDQTRQAEPQTRQVPFPTKTGSGRYVCQSTELLRATQPLSKLDLRQYYREWRARTYSPSNFVRSLVVPFWIRLKVLTRGMSCIRVRGNLSRTPSESLNLQPGEWVKVKSREEIEQTLDANGRNRGLEFARYMLPFCGRRLKVRKRVDRIILETTGEMRQIKDTVILEDCTCDGFTRWGFCPRDSHHLWREIWLRRIDVKR
jgi:hypothetical protein